MSDSVSLYEAKTHLSSLVDRAAAGEEFVITKNGVPLAKLVSAAVAQEPRRPAHALGVTRIADNFDAADPELERQFYGERE